MNTIDINVIKKNNSYKNSLLHSKKKASGEIFKEPFLDIFLTDLEQTSFSLIVGNLKKETLNGEGFVTLKQSFNKAWQTKVLTSPIAKSPAGVFAKAGLFAFPTSPLQSARSKLMYRGIIKFIANSGNNNLKTSSYLFALDNWIGKDISFTSYISFLFNLSAKKKKTLKTLENRSKLDFYNSLQDNKPISCLLKIGDYVHCGDKLGYLSGKNALQRACRLLAKASLCKTKLCKSCAFARTHAYVQNEVMQKHSFCTHNKVFVTPPLTLEHTVSPLIINESGKLLKINKSQVTIQKMQPVLFYSQAEIHVESKEWVKRGTPLLTLAHQTLVTGDIVQGIPRIEQLFEASTSAPPGAALQDFNFHSEEHLPLSQKRRNKVTTTETSSVSKLDKPSFSSASLLHAKYKNEGTAGGSGLSELNLNINQFVAGATQSDYSSTVHFVTEKKPLLLYQTLQSQVRETFRKKWNQLPLPLAVRQSLEEIQQIIVESIQKVYISQGVLIADKHIEIIVRQMTSKAQIFDGGSTGLLVDEILSLQQIENANISTPGQKAVYLPVIMGLTRAALSSDSFVSAASFQETTRVLSRDAVAGKTDFLRGLKEKVIIGDLIDAGTGLDVFYIYSLFSKNIFENKFRNILNRKITHKTLKKLVLTVTKCSPDGFRCTSLVN